MPATVIWNLCLFRSTGVHSRSRVRDALSILFPCHLLGVQVCDVLPSSEYNQGHGMLLFCGLSIACLGLDSSSLTLQNHRFQLMEMDPSLFLRLAVTFLDILHSSVLEKTQAVKGRRASWGSTAMYVLFFSACLLLIIGRQPVPLI